MLIDKRQLLYLKTVLDRPNHDWTRKMLFVLQKTDIGWASQINRKLEEYSLETSWERTEKRNKKLLIDMC